MKVRILTAFAEDFHVYNPGQELEVSDAVGVGMLRRGVAERMESEPETATAPNRGERAVRPVRTSR